MGFQIFWIYSIVLYIYYNIYIYMAEACLVCRDLICLGWGLGFRAVRFLSASGWAHTGRATKTGVRGVGGGFVPRKTWLWYLKIWGTTSHDLSLHSLWNWHLSWSLLTQHFREGCGISMNNSEMIWCWYHFGTCNMCITSHGWQINMKFPTTPPGR